MWSEIWSKVRIFIGDLWGKATTLALTFGVAVLAVPLPPELMNPTVRWGLFGIAVAVGFLRQVAPPPPAMPIKKADTVEVDHAASTVKVFSAEPLPAAMESKAAGVEPREPPSPSS